MDMSVALGAFRLDNPVIPASGCFGYGAEFKDYYDLDVLGSFTLKGTTLNPRYGNPLPRVAETPAGMLNSVGLQNPGAAHVVKEELPALDGFFHKQVIANVCGFSAKEYAQVTEILGADRRVGLVEVNVSCPNVHCGGMAFGLRPESAAEVTRACRERTDKPLFIKLSPACADIVSVAKACMDAGADGLTLINTLPGLRIDLKTRKPVLANEIGGLSGPCIFPIALRMVRDVYRATRAPIIGTGGITTARDVIEMLLAGATAVGVGMANLTDPWACARIVANLPAVMAEYKIDSLQSIIGGAA